MKATLYAVSKGEPNIEIEFREVDLVGAENLEELLKEVTDCKIITAKKSCEVSARRAEVGQVVDTRPRVNVNGKVYTMSETKRTITQEDVDKNSMLVTNPDGEVYVVKGEKFERTYSFEHDSSDGEAIFRPIDDAKKFVTVTEDISFKAPWGETIFAPKGSKLCVEYLDSRDIYSVTNSAFESTYKEVEEEQQ